MPKLNKTELKEIRNSWKDVNIDLLTENDKLLYTKRKKAVDLYIEGVKVKTISDTTGLPSSEIIRLVNRCLIPARDGNLNGYSALIPNRIARSSINKFQKLLSTYPTLEPFLLGNYYGNKEYTLEHNMSIRTLHSKFLNECLRIGVPDYEYPFTLKDKGYMELLRYISKKNLNLTDKAITREGKDARQKFKSTGYGNSISINPLMPYNVVQLDGHKIDLLYVVEVENKQGEIVLMPATRVWLIAIIDIATRAIIGYSISPYENYNQFDVMQAIYNSIKTHDKINFTHTGFKYPENGGFPSLAIPETQWAVFDTIMLDNAKAHLASNTVNKLVNIVNCSVNFGSVATPETRGIVERFFKTLETSGFHRLPGTTGSSTKDNKRKNPEKESAKYQIKYQDIFEILEYLIAEYNNSAHSELECQTPLQVMDRRIRQSKMQPYIVQPSDRVNIEKITYFTEERTLRGGYSSGTKPYISYLGTKYHGYDVQLPMAMIGEKVSIEVNPADVSHVDLYDKNGVFVANLVATGEWGRRPHSLKTHKAALKRKSENLEINSIFSPVLSEYENDLRENARKSRRKRTEAAIVERELGKPYTNPKPAPPINFKKEIKENNSSNFSQDEIDLLEKLSIEEAYKRGLF